MCTEQNCKNWRQQLAYQQYQLAGWTITTKERTLHSNRLKINVSFENDSIVIYPPDKITLDLDDCNGQKYFECLKWIDDHPIKTGQEYQLSDITEHIYPPPTKKHFEIRED